MLHYHLNSCKSDLGYLRPCNNQALMWPNEESWLTFSAERRYPFFFLSLPAGSATPSVGTGGCFAGKKRPENEVDHAHLVQSLRVELQKYWNRTKGRLAHDIVTVPTPIYVRRTLPALPSAVRQFI